MSDPVAPFEYSGAMVDITPSAAVPLAGYAARNKPFSGVASNLEANAILLRGNARQVLFISADVLFFGEQLVASITRRAEDLGLLRDDIVLTASHTHFAPATDDSKPQLGAVDRDYIHLVEERLLALLESVMAASPFRVTLELTRSSTELTVGRRRRWPLPILTRRGLKLPPNIVSAPAKDAPRDQRVDVIKVVDNTGRIRAVFWKFACHPVCFPERERVSSEYPGQARAALRRAAGGSIPVVFWQGFAGDVRPRMKADVDAKWPTLSWRGTPVFRKVTAAAWTRWADQVAGTVMSAFTSPTVLHLHGPLRSVGSDVPISALVDPEANPQWSDRSMRVQLVSFGDVQALFVGAEVCSPYLGLLRFDRDTIFVGYANDVYGYLPSAQQAAEGGYEGRDFFEAFSLRGTLRPGFESVVRAAVTALHLETERAQQA